MSIFTHAACNLIVRFLQAHANGVLIGYARVSTLDQNPTMQRDALNDGCAKPFVEQMSGAIYDRLR